MSSRQAGRATWYTKWLPTRKTRTSDGDKLSQHITLPREQQPASIILKLKNRFWSPSLPFPTWRFASPPFQREGWARWHWVKQKHSEGTKIPLQNWGITASKELCWKYTQLPLALRPKYRHSALGVLICSREEENLEKKALCTGENPKNAVHLVERRFCAPRRGNVKIPGAHFCCMEPAHLVTQTHWLPAGIRLTPPSSSLLAVQWEGSAGAPYVRC